MDTLKPCPFCGSDKVIDEGAPSYDTVTEEERTTWFTVLCTDCHAEGPPNLGWSGAIEAWNTRPLEDELREALKRMVNNLPEPEIELAREVWGNTNTQIILVARTEAQAAIQAAEGGEVE